MMLTERDFKAALDLLGALAEAGGDRRSFAAVGVARLPALVASEFTTLSVCDLVSGRREVYGLPAGGLSADERAAFDRHFKAHPLVRYHGYEGGALAQRISDCLPYARFRRGALFNDYYRRIGIHHAVAVPVFVRDGLLVSFVLNRSRRDFSDRERTLLDLLRPQLARLYRRASQLDRLTAREAEILHWVALGKSDRQIGAILGISARTVQKHLEKAYPKLGVESRTAAAMRAYRA
jgi:DNA-binding CsgD family transcriptional regulator